MATPRFQNPFRPGAGHMPPYLAGRESEKAEFGRLLEQSTILENLVLTGLRGVGKTVLLDTLKPLALGERWLWVGNDVSEATSITEANLTTRLLTDLAVSTGAVVVGTEVRHRVGLPRREELVAHTLDFDNLLAMWDETPGLASDKLKAVLEETWRALEPLDVQGIVFAYDEAQNLADHATRDEYPLSLLLDVFQSLQRKGTPYLLVLAGLPTLFSKLVETRTFTERMFHVITLERLNREASEDAMLKPIEDAACPVQFTPESVELVYEVSKGYPYFIQYICRETFDVWTIDSDATVPVSDITRKLDADFFAGRWARATDRQRDLLTVIAHLDNADTEFSVQDIVRASEAYDRPFSSSHANRMLVTLASAGLVYKNRWGRYSLAVPLLNEFILRQEEELSRRG